MANLDEPYNIVHAKSIDSEIHDLEDNPWDNDHQQNNATTNPEPTETRNTEGNDANKNVTTNSDTQSTETKEPDEPPEIIKRTYKHINDFRPSCPCVCFEHDEELFTLNCQSLDIFVECYASTAIVKMKGKWVNETKHALQPVFTLQTTGTVTNVTIKIKSANVSDDRIITTSIVSKYAASELIREINPTESDYGPHNNEEKKQKEQDPFQEYIPGIFKIPITSVKEGDIINITCEYIEPLDYYKKGYVLALPLRFPPGTISEFTQWQDIVHIECKINAFISNTKIDCWSHEITTKIEDNGVVIVNAGKCKEIEMKRREDLDRYCDVAKTGRDFELAYSVKSDKIMAHCIQETDIANNNNGSLCIFITPPAILNATFQRAFYFLLDKSGMMAGQPYDQIIRGLNRVLSRLRSTDLFNICLFDHKQVYYEKQLVPATEETVNNAKLWMSQYKPDSDTKGKGKGLKMDKAIYKSLKQLEDCGEEYLTFMVLVTGGSVRSEREILDKIEANTKLKTRIFTLGLGQYCNWSFLKKLAKLGKGVSDICVYPERIYHQFDHLLRQAQTPVITDINIIDDGEFEYYPYPISDLYVGAPVIIAVRYKNTKCPEKMELFGTLPNGDEKCIECVVENRDDLPVEKIFIKQQIDIMTADACLNEDKGAAEIINISINSNMPSIFTDFVVFETTQSALDKQQSQITERNGHLYGDSRYRKGKIMAGIRNNPRAVSALAVGGTAAIIAVTAISFGNIDATLEQVSIFGNVGFDGEAPNGGPIDNCDDCDCDCDCDDGIDCDCDIPDCIVM